MNTKKIILLLVLSLVMSIGVNASCWDSYGNPICGLLTKKVCDGDILYQQNGFCDSKELLFSCGSYRTELQDCNAYDDLLYCRSRSNAVWIGDGYCSDGQCNIDYTFVKSCDDGISCTDDTCNDSSCVHTPNCDDGNPCTIDICDAINGCQYTNKPAGADCGICAECDGLGSCSQTPADDNNCGMIDCDGLDTACRGYDDVIDNRCEGLGDCKDPNTQDCIDYIDYPDTTDCGVCALCDGFGNCNVYDETQNNDCSCPNDACSDANNDGIIDVWNDYNEAECVGIFTCNDCGPSITEPDDRCKTAMKIPIDQYVSMFSLPLIPEGGTITFNDIQSGCTFTGNATLGITYWDPLKADDNKYVYIDANTSLYPGQGYFTTQENECDFTIEGYKFTAKYLGYLGTKNIHNGWNMIGAPSDPINNFDLVEGTCTVVSGPWGHDAVNYRYVRTQKLEPGKGYFIKTNNGCNLV